MRAAVCTQLSPGEPVLEIRNLPDPEPGPGEVRVKVAASSVNFPDILMCRGEYQHRPDPPFIPGMEAAGVVDGLGAVTGWAVGDRVAGGAKTGGFAEYICLPAEGLHRVPDNFDLVHAAAYPAAYLTAYVALVRRANLQPGETLLVHGATGGVGMAAVEVGKLLGATVIAASASKDKLAAVMAQGADHGISSAPGFREEVKALTGGRGADVIFDPVGGDVFDKSTRCIAFDGRLLVVGFASGRIPQIGVNMPLIKGFSVIGVRAGEYGRRFPERGKENLDAIWRWAAEGRTHPHVCATFGLEKVRDAFAMLTERRVVGKVAILPGGAD